jgi:hypothetical protein
MGVGDRKGGERTWVFSFPYGGYIGTKQENKHPSQKRCKNKCKNVNKVSHSQLFPVSGIKYQVP